MKQELTEGLIIKNYKVLCEEYLGVKPTKGACRKYHFKELERYCDYHRFLGTVNHGFFKGTAGCALIYTTALRGYGLLRKFTA